MLIVIYLIISEFIQKFIISGVAQICSLCLGEVCGDVENPLHEWSVQFPVEKKPSLKEKLNYVVSISLIYIFRKFRAHHPAIHSQLSLDKLEPV